MSSAARVGLRPTGFSLSRNLSLYTIPAVYLSAFIPHTIKVILMGRSFNNEDPRNPDYDGAAAGQSPLQSKKYKTQLQRLGWMHTNGMESLPLYFTAILIGNYARLPTRLLSIFSLSYLASRVAYNFLYFYQDGPVTAWSRTGTYFAGMLGSLWILVKSAKKVYEL